MKLFTKTALAAAGISMATMALPVLLLGRL